MDSKRREFLGLITVGGVLSISGCAGDDGEVSDPSDEQSEPASGSDNDSDTGSESDADSDPDPDSDSDSGSDSSDDNVAELGETLVYTNDDQQLAFKVAEASLHDAIVTSYSSTLSSTVPENPDYTFLDLLIEVENQGSEEISTPGELTFTLNGTQYERTFTGIIDNSYEEYNDILPDNHYSGRILFPIPPNNGEGRLVVNFSNWGDAVTGEWIINLGDINRQRHDYTGNQPGDMITFGTDQRQYQIGAIDSEEAQSYTYTSNGYEFKEEASEGNKFVLVTVGAENTGDSAVFLPSVSDLSIRTDSSQHDTATYFGSDAYEGGDVSAGVQREGIVLFEVPESLSGYSLQVDLTLDLTGTWEL